MALKKRKPFILNDKEAARKEYEFSKLLTLSLVFSAFIIPFLNDGAVSLLHGLYVSGDYTLKWLDIFLSYFIPLISACAVYFSYAAVVLSIYYYTSGKSVGRITCLMGGVLFSYLVVYICTCIENGYVLFDVSDEGSFFALLSMVIMSVFMLSKNAVLLIYTHVTVKRMKKDDQSVWLSPCNGENAGFFKRAFGKTGANLKLALHFFSVSLVCDIIVRSVSTYLEIASAGKPEEFSHYLYFAERYALVLLNNLFGFVVMVIAGGILGKFVSEKEEKAFPNNVK